MNHSFIHVCTIQLRMKKQKLSFDAGTVAFTLGETVTGAGGATGTVDRMVLESGAWSGSAVGYVVLSSVVGTFANDESLVGSVTGRATVNGVNTDYKNSYGEFEYYWGAAYSDVPCKFFTITRRQRVMDAGEFTQIVVMCWIPPVCAIAEDAYRIYSAQVPFTGTFEIKAAKPITTQAVSVHHYECELLRVS